MSETIKFVGCERLRCAEASVCFWPCPVAGRGEALAEVSPGCSGRDRIVVKGLSGGRQIRKCFKCVLSRVGRQTADGRECLGRGMGIEVSKTSSYFKMNQEKADELRVKAKARGWTKKDMWKASLITREMADEYGISIQTVRQILREETWMGGGIQRITDDEVRYIRRMIRDKMETKLELADRFDVSIQYITNVVNYWSREKVDPHLDPRSVEQRLGRKKRSKGMW
jgi:transposase